MMRAVLLVCILLVASVASAGKKADKHPDRTARDLLAARIAKEVEHDGYNGIGIWAAYPGGCGLAGAFHRQNHDCLCIINGAFDVQGVDRFWRDEIEPRLDEITDLGFVEVDFAKLEPSNTYPTGYARLPVPTKLTGAQTSPAGGPTDSSREKSKNDLDRTTDEAAQRKAERMTRDYCTNHPDNEYCQK